MTRDRARKRAVRDRVAATGERYVVARREAVETPSHDGGRLHELTHRVRGVPAHVEGGLHARARRNPSAPPANQGRPNQNQPRILVGWQNRIARLFGAR